MTGDIPRTQWERGLSGGKTAARMGRKALAYLARRPFLTEEKRLTARQTLNRETAVALFEGLSLLRGTALKAAQMLSMELDLFPPEVTEELRKSCHEVPPINRALARKVVQNALGGPPEAFFRTFDANAFAAASLGQVHRATSKDGASLAVKIQYPGIRETIQSDMRLMRTALRAHPDRRSLEPVMEEIEARLLEETDYGRELRNMAFFRERLGMDRVEVPAAWVELSADTVLAAGVPARQAHKRLAADRPRPGSAGPGGPDHPGSVHNRALPAALHPCGPQSRQFPGAGGGQGRVGGFRLRQVF